MHGVPALVLVAWCAQARGCKCECTRVASAYRLHAGTCAVPACAAVIQHTWSPLVACLGRECAEALWDSAQLSGLESGTQWYSVAIALEWQELWGAKAVWDDLVSGNTSVWLASIWQQVLERFLPPVLFYVQYACPML